MYDICKDNEIIYETITSEEQALSMRTKYQTLEMGVFFIDKAFGRGFDAKLKKDAYVCIYEAGGDIDSVYKIKP